MVQRLSGPRPVVAIIGGGVSGSLTAVHLARLLPRDIDIELYERANREARGLAYKTREPGHLLNVRAANMSAFADAPTHFEDWLATTPHAAGAVEYTAAGVFAARQLYGTYLEDVLHDARDAEGRPRPITIRRTEVQALKRRGDAFYLCDADGAVRRADAVVLSLGNVTGEVDTAGPVFSNPWAPEATRALDSKRPVLIQGTGLTMIDTLLALRRQGFTGPIFALSRHGFLPQVHAPAAAAAPPKLEAHEVVRLSQLLKRVRHEVNAAQDRGGDWRTAIDAMRPVTQQIWRRLPDSEKQRFLRHARAWWDSHRHRVAPPIAEAIERERSSGSLAVIAGRIIHFEATKDSVLVSYRRRGCEETEVLRVQRLISATGVPSVADTRDALITALLAGGTARLDELRLGLDVDERFGVRDRGGSPVNRMWALGPLVRGVFWECTAVPDIRVQAERVAEAVAESLRPRESVGSAGVPLLAAAVAL